MADYAGVFDGISGKAIFSQVTFSDNLDIKIELKFVTAKTGGIISDGTANRYFRFASNSLRFRSNSTNYSTWSFTPTLLQDYVFDIECRTSSVELFIDTVSQGTRSGAFGAWLVNTIAMYNTNLFSDIIIKRITITDNDTPVNSRDWFNNVSAGSNVNWKDQSANAQDATLVGTATNGDQWELIGGGGGVTVTPTSITSEESFGEPTIAISSAVISPLSITSQESFGVPVIVTAAIIVTPTSITSEESFGIPFIVFDQAVLAQSIPSGESFGIPIISDGLATIIPVEFRGTSNKIAEYLNSTGKFTSEQVNDIIVEWLRLENTNGETFNDLFYNYWQNNGFDGTYTDKQDKWRNE